MKNEADVKKVVKEILTRRGAYFFMPVQTGYGRLGIPDFAVCYQGYYIAIETKFGGNKPTAHQFKELDLVQVAGGRALVINEKNLSMLEMCLDFLDAHC